MAHTIHIHNYTYWYRHVIIHSKQACVCVWTGSSEARRRSVWRSVTMHRTLFDRYRSFARIVHAMCDSITQFREPNIWQWTTHIFDGFRERTIRVGRSRVTFAFFTNYGIFHSRRCHNGTVIERIKLVQNFESQLGYRVSKICIYVLIWHLSEWKKVKILPSRLISQGALPDCKNRSNRSRTPSDRMVNGVLPFL